jgi:hypothetical protein
MTVVEMTFEQVVKVARQLRPEQKAALVKTLQAESMPSSVPTRSELIAEMEALRSAGAFEQIRSLRNRYPAPSLKHVSDRQLLAAIHETSSEWGADLEELLDHGD